MEEPLLQGRRIPVELQLDLCKGFLGFFGLHLQTNSRLSQVCLHIVQERLKIQTKSLCYISLTTFRFVAPLLNLFCGVFGVFTLPVVF